MLGLWFLADVAVAELPACHGIALQFVVEFLECLDLRRGQVGEGGGNIGGDIGFHDGWPFSFACLLYVVMRQAPEVRVVLDCLGDTPWCKLTWCTWMRSACTRECQ